MRKRSFAAPILTALTVVLLSSCSSSRLYYWGSSPMLDKGTTRYEELAYRSYDKQSPESICALLCLYDDLVKNPGGSRGVVPPGICAEYGYLLLLPTTAEAFEKHATSRQKKHFSSSNYTTEFPKLGEEMLKKEMELYPESKKFIEPILKRLSGK